jgi:hypothetical protein
MVEAPVAGPEKVWENRREWDRGTVYLYVREECIGSANDRWMMYGQNGFMRGRPGAAQIFVKPTRLVLTCSRVIIKSLSFMRQSSRTLLFL